MKRKTIIFYLTILVTITVKGQNPLPALKAYQYSTDNNKIDIDKEFENALDKMTFTNVFFKYFKNHQYDQTFQSDKIMLFRIQYEYMIQTIVADNNEISLKFRCNKKYDNLTKLTLTRYSQENGKTTSKKLSKKDYEIITDDSTITVKPNATVLVPGNVLRIFCSVESTDINLKNLSPLNRIDNSTDYISFNEPEIFKYLTDNKSLELINKTTGEMKLIKFEYDVSRLTEVNNILSTTYKWKIKAGFTNSNIFFPLISIDLPDKIGTSVPQIMKKGSSIDLF